MKEQIKQAAGEDEPDRTEITDGPDSGPLSYEAEEALARRRKDQTSKFSKASGKLKGMLEKEL